VKAAPRETRETTLAGDDDSTDDDEFRRSMRNMDYWIRWYDRGHESWFLRELRWREQGRVS
jgi:hypothetical protein